MFTSSIPDTRFWDKSGAWYHSKDKSCKLKVSVNIAQESEDSVSWRQRV